MAETSSKTPNALILPEISNSSTNVRDSDVTMSGISSRSSTVATRRSRTSPREIAFNRGRLKLRARNVEIKPVDPQAALPVQPWAAVRSAIATLLGAKPGASGSGLLPSSSSSSIGSSSAGPTSTSASPRLLSTPHISTDLLRIDLNQRTNSQLMTLQQVMQQNPNLPALPITISHGFQLIRTLPHLRPILSVLYIPTSSMFVSLDPSFVNLWKGNSRIHRISTHAENDNVGARGTSTSSQSSSITKSTQKGTLNIGAAHSSGVVAITKWIYLEKQRVYIVANTRLEIKVLDNHFEELSIVSNPKPVLSIQYIPEKKEIICGEVGSIRIWKIIRSHLIHKEVYYLEERRAILRDLEEEWVACVYYDRLLDRIFAACDTNLYVYDYETGDRIDNYYSIHDLAITCVTFYEPFEYLITGGKDGSIKVWNARKYLMFDFHDHFNAITSLALLEKGCEASFGSMPLLLSSSLDATIRMWNFETGQSLYRLDTNLPCLGIAFIKKNHFYHYTKDSIQVWNVNRYQMTFVFFRSMPLIIRRVTHPNKPARIVTAVADGSIKMVSPVSGIVLSTGFPAHKDSVTKDFAYDMSTETLYCFNSNGDVVIYDTNVNPFRIQDIWEAPKTFVHEQITCLCGLEFYKHVIGSSYDAESRILTKSKRLSPFFLVAGTTGGQIILIDLAQQGKYEVLAQAHSAGITMLSFDHRELLLISGAEDAQIKVWALRCIDSKTTFSNAIAAGMNGQNTARTLSMTLKSTISLGNFGIPSRTIALSEQTTAMAVPFNGGILVSDYTKDMTLAAGKVEQEQVGKVCAIASGHDHGIWATGNDDGTVKIWDADNTIIREIQFNDTISSLCFANTRGDLLVGISDQISIVRVQDYMPYNYLKLMLSKDYYDDENEMPIAFDPNLEFWQYRYDSEKQDQGEVRDWHMQKGQISDTKLVEDELGYLLKLSQQRKEESIRRRNRERFLANEHSGFMHALRFQRERNAKSGDESYADLDRARELTMNQYGGAFARGELTFDKWRFGDNRRTSLEAGTSNPYLAVPLEPSTPTNEATQQVSASEQDEPEAISVEIKIETKGQVTTESAPASAGLVGAPAVDSEPQAPSPVPEAGPVEPIANAIQAQPIVERVSETKPPVPKQLGRSLIKQQLRRTDVALPNSAFIAEVSDGRQMIQRGRSGRGRSRESTKEDETPSFMQDVWGKTTDPVTALPKAKTTSKKSRGRSMADAIEAAHKRRAKHKPVEVSHFDEKLVNLDEDEDEDSAAQQAASDVPHLEVTSAGGAVDAHDDRDHSDTHSKKSTGKRSRKNTLTKKPETGSNAQLKAASADRPAASKETLVVPDSKSKRDESAGSSEEHSQMPQPVVSIALSVPQPTQEVLSASAEPGSTGAAAGEQSQAAQDENKAGMAQAAQDEGTAKPQRPITTHIEFQPFTPHVVDIATAWEVRKPPPPERSSFIINRNSELHGEGKGGYSAVAKVRKSIQPFSQEAAPIAFGSRRPSRASFLVPRRESQAELQATFEKFKKQPPTLTRTMSSESDLAVEEAAHFVWNMFRNYTNTERISETMKPLTQHFTNENPTERIEISTVANVLGGVLKNGTEEQTIEASKAMLFLYRTFRTDFRSPLQQFIIPQIDLLAHESSEVRATLCDNISKYGVYHETVLLGLVYSLNDPDPTVVEAAMRGLAQFGINDKAMLRAAMIHLGMIRGELVHFYENTSLEKIGRNARLNALKHVRETNWTIQEWLDKIDIHAQQMRRGDSYPQHLAGKFFPPDAGDHEGLARTRMLNERGTNNPMDMRSLDGMSGDISLTSAGYIDGWDIRSDQSQRILGANMNVSGGIKFRRSKKAEDALDLIHEQSEPGSEHVSMPTTPKGRSVHSLNVAAIDEIHGSGAIAAQSSHALNVIGTPQPRASNTSHRGACMRASLMSTFASRTIPAAVIKMTHPMTAGALLAQRAARRLNNHDKLRPKTTGVIMSSDKYGTSRFGWSRSGRPETTPHLLHRRPHTVAATVTKDIFPPL